MLRGGPALLLTVLVIAAAVYSFSIRPPAPADPTVIGADQLHVNGLAQQGSRWVAAGELGHILITDDLGSDWREAAVTPSRGTTLTQVHFVDERTAVAVGHEGWILRSTDAGESWHEVAFDAAAPEPYLGVAGPFNGRLFAFGAFGLMQVSDDGGASWRRQPIVDKDAKVDGSVAAMLADSDDPFADPFASFQDESGVGDRHLNDMIELGDGALLLVGERGLLLRSDNGGESWTVLPEIYAGSFFGAVRTATNAVVVFGMRGNVFRSEDHGRSWTRAILPEPPASIFGGAVDAAGRVLLVGAADTRVLSTDDGRSYTRLANRSRNTLADAHATNDGAWLIAGQDGIQTLRNGAGDRP